MPETDKAARRQAVQQLRKQHATDLKALIRAWPKDGRWRSLTELMDDNDPLRTALHRIAGNGPDGTLDRFFVHRLLERILHRDAHGYVLRGSYSPMRGYEFLLTPIHEARACARALTPAELQAVHEEARTVADWQHAEAAKEEAEKLRKQAEEEAKRAEWPAERLGSPRKPPGKKRSPRGVWLTSKSIVGGLKPVLQAISTGLTRPNQPPALNSTL